MKDLFRAFGVLRKTIHRRKDRRPSRAPLAISLPEKQIDNVNMSVAYSLQYVNHDTA